MKLFISTFIIFLGLSNLQAQEVSDSTKTLYVYLDCRGWCQESFVRSEIQFVSFVRDQGDAEVHLIITRQGTGSGGTQYNMEFIGLGDYSATSNQIVYTSFDSDTQEEERSGLVQHIKLGLVPFLTQKDVLSNFDLNFTGNVIETSQRESADKWNNWVFEVGANTWFAGEESESSLNLNSRFRARRITDTWKFTFSYDYRYNRDTFADDSTRIDIVNGDSVSVNVNYDEVFTVDRQNIFSQLVYSISDHWSFGGYMTASSSSRDNIDFQIGATPAIEYSFYPYREFARREVTLRYGLFTSFYDYKETTIYNKDTELLLRQELAFNMDYTQPWGSVETRLNGRTYLHDFSKKRLNLDFEINFRVTRGLFISFETGYSVINDQLSLPLDDDITTAEALADTRQQATSFEYYGVIGFEFTFGSIYDNVVNTRF